MSDAEMTFIRLTASSACRTKPPRRQGGVTMIEILITLLVLSVGLLGLAALQGFSLQAGQVSYHRTQATNVAYEAADFARANRSIATSTLLTNVANNLASERLPSGSATVTGPSPDDVITVTVTWLDDREDTNNGNLSFAITTRI
jgi:type IV pilus assembly protein PilV